MTMNPNNKRNMSRRKNTSSLLPLPTKNKKRRQENHGVCSFFDAYGMRMIYLIDV
jgi:hypothetical protein